MDMLRYPSVASFDKFASGKCSTVYSNTPSWSEASRRASQDLGPDLSAVDDPVYIARSGLVFCTTLPLSPLLLSRDFHPTSNVRSFM